jgi:uncharacterized protein (DUF608 family)
MSKHETPMTRWYWRTVNKRQGLLIEEFAALKGNKEKGHSKRHIDGVIVLGQPAERRGPRKDDRALVKGKRVIVIQSKNRRLGMGLIGQVVVSHKLLEDLGADVLKSVGVCKEDDKVLHRVLRRFEGCEAIVHRRTRRKKPATKSRRG